MQNYTEVYKRYFDPSVFAPASPKTASRELPRAAAYRALMSLKYKYHQDATQPMHGSDLATSSPLFDHSELLNRAEEAAVGWTKRNPAQRLHYTSAISIETRREADHLWNLWTNTPDYRDTQRQTAPNQLSNPAAAYSNTQQQSRSVPLGSLGTSVSPPPSPSTFADANDKGLVHPPPAASPDNDPLRVRTNTSSTVSRLAGARTPVSVAAGTTGASAEGLKRQQQQQRGSIGTSNSTYAAVAAAGGAATAASAQQASQPQPGVQKTNLERKMPKNMNGTKALIQDQDEITSHGGLTGTQSVGKIDLKNL